MATITLDELGPLVKSERGSRGIRETAADIGISPATLSRIENGSLPDITTFGSICQWLDIDPSDIVELGGHLSNSDDEPEFTAGATVHFRADVTPTRQLGENLAKLIAQTRKKVLGDSGN